MALFVKKVLFFYFDYLLRAYTRSDEDLFLGRILLGLQDDLWFHSLYFERCDIRGILYLVHNRYGLLSL